MTDIAFAPAKQLAGMIRRKKIGCLELLDHYLARMARHNPALNAIVVTDIPAARKRARAADRALARDEIWGPLHGVPMTVKESFQVKGLPTTFGIPALKDNFSPRNALAVDRWLGAGAVIFGKTNVPLMLADSQSFNDIYGTTNNPWDLTRSPGGSSGGASAAIAAGMTAIEMGSDIGSSIRNPAHFCGIFGHKPTWGVCPPRGHGPDDTKTPTDISVIGPLARSVDDLLLGLEVMAGPDEIDSRGLRLALPAPRQKSLKDFKVGMLLDHEASPVDREVKRLLRDLVAFLRKAGAKVDTKARPKIDLEDIHRTYHLLVCGAASARTPDDVYAAQSRLARRLDPADDSIRARGLRGATITHRDWLRAHEARNKMRWRWHEFFRDYDLMLMPALNTAAMPHDHSDPLSREVTINGRTIPFMAQVFWAGYTGVTYLPAATAPIGFTKAGLPVGVQIAGPQYGDLICLRFAQFLEKEYQAFVPPPAMV